jgi:hypothetical protein
MHTTPRKLPQKQSPRERFLWVVCLRPFGWNFSEVVRSVKLPICWQLYETTPYKPVTHKTSIFLQGSPSKLKKYKTFWKKNHKQNAGATKPCNWCGKNTVKPSEHVDQTTIESCSRISWIFSAFCSAFQEDDNDTELYICTSSSRTRMFCVLNLRALARLFQIRLATASAKVGCQRFWVAFEASSTKKSISVKRCLTELSKFP